VVARDAFFTYQAKREKNAAVRDRPRPMDHAAPLRSLKFISDSKEAKEVSTEL